MKTNFKLLFKVEVKHTYFKDNICNCLRFVPAIETINILKKFKGVIKSSINGFDLYAETPASLNDWLENIQQETGAAFFDFDIEYNNPAFINFTDLPLAKMEKLAFYSDVAQNINNCNSLKLVETFSTDSQPGHLGNLRVCFEDITLSATESYYKYLISFKARATQWQYYVINTGDVLMDNPIIIGTQDITFEGPRAVLLENGQQALLFSSGNKLLQLSMQPLYTFGLFNKSATGKNAAESKTTLKTIIKCLPAPGEGTVSIKNEDGEVTVLSPIYVYV